MVTCAKRRRTVTLRTGGTDVVDMEGKPVTACSDMRGCCRGPRCHRMESTHQLVQRGEASVVLAFQVGGSSRMWQGYRIYVAVNRVHIGRTGSSPM